jgi:hypothetical protein
MEKRGLVVQRLSGELEQEWTAYAESLQVEFRGPVVPADTFDEILRLRAEYRAR